MTLRLFVGPVAGDVVLLFLLHLKIEASNSLASLNCVLSHSPHHLCKVNRSACHKLIIAPVMDSDEGYNYEFDDEEEECSEDSAEEETEDDTLELGDVELVDPVVAGGERDECGETGGSGHGPGQDEEDYRFEVLTAEQILQHMVECIREVNEVIQVGIQGCQLQEISGTT